MGSGVEVIPFSRLLIAFVPVLLMVAVLFIWSLTWKNALYAVLRMVVQLLLIGYALNFLFATDSSLLILGLLLVMVIASSWISLNTVEGRRRELLAHALVSIGLVGGSTLALVTQGVLVLDPWYEPRFLIPIAGMIFSNALTAVSLAAERMVAEQQRGVQLSKARSIALTASLIPITNALFAVGLVALPGMMTGQILSGVSPLVAVRYQILVMCMTYGASGLAAALFLYRGWKAEAQRNT
ncbi:ABC transporter permease [Aestuariirhabdus sp. Z084]|uniref:ABC transporter permease n=1 Tax=Aestuariirhabdus haliotis TaxID=2918751 RepID=UPI00201B3AB2|nr:ABC transporter permease [Aestuariirhabdus haliotis]MCL6415996.1 ABC transporter permease [Aestuariirhabdus haliotis]MCL6419971.1 ABC transporter permease [Aestuariirhabdus haliotis]